MYMDRDRDKALGIKVGLSIGSVVALLLFVVLCCVMVLRLKKRRKADEVKRPAPLPVQVRGEKSSDEVPIRVRGENASRQLSNTLPGQHHHHRRRFWDDTLSFGTFLPIWGRSHVPESYHGSSHDRITQFTYK
jgi:hypothetical protein